MSAPLDWKKGRLGEQCSIEIGGTPSRNVPEYWDDAKETANTWVSIRDLNRRVITHTAEHISDEGVKRSNVKLQLEGTVLLSFKLSIGRVAFAGLPLYTNEAIAGLRSDEITHDFLYFGLQQWDLLQGVDQAIKGATLNKAKLKNIEFTFPESKPEQVKIAEILLAVDRAIEQTESLIAKQQRLKTGLMQDLLTRGIDEFGNLRSESTHPFKDSPLGRVPVDWEVTTFETRVESSAFGPRFPATAYSETGNLGLLRTTDLDEFGNIAYANMPRATLDAKVFQHHFLQNEDLLLSRSGTIGVPAVFENFEVPVIPGAFLIRFRLDAEKASAAYWRNYFNWEQGRHRLVSLAEGGVQKNLRASAVNKMLMAFPSGNEQKEVARRLDQFDQNAKVEHLRLQKQQSLKAALMQDLLTSRKRVTPLLEEDQTSQEP